MYKFNFKHRIRYADTDQMGYAYYGNYPKYYEIGRVELIRSLGFSYNSFETDLGIMLPVVNLEARYIKPAYYDDEITIETQLRELPSKMITFHHKIFNEKEELINKGIVKLFFINMETNLRVSSPQILLDNLIQYFE